MSVKVVVVLLGLLAATSAVPSKPSAAAEKTAAVPEEETANSLAEEGEENSFPYRDLPADVLRDFPGLCFGSTALRLFHVGQSWSLAPFCGVATCLVTEDHEQMVERVQDCGPQPKKNPKCRNVNNSTAMDVPFPKCCPQYECEEGVELEYPTPEELLKMAADAAEAVVQGQYEEEAEVERQARKAEIEEETSAEETENNEEA